MSALSQCRVWQHPWSAAQFYPLAALWLLNQLQSRLFQRDGTVPATVLGHSSPWLPIASMSFAQPHRELGWWINLAKTQLSLLLVEQLPGSNLLHGHMSDGTIMKGQVAACREKGVRPLLSVQHWFSLCCLYNRPHIHHPLSMLVWLNIELLSPFWGTS